MPGRFQLMSSLPICYIFSFGLLIFDQLSMFFVLEIVIQIPRHIFIIWCMRRRFSAVFILPGSSSARAPPRGRPWGRGWAGISPILVPRALLTRGQRSATRGSGQIHIKLASDWLQRRLLF